MVMAAAGVEYGRSPARRCQGAIGQCDLRNGASSTVGGSYSHRPTGSFPVNDQASYFTEIDQRPVETLVAQKITDAVIDIALRDAIEGYRHPRRQKTHRCAGYFYATVVDQSARRGNTFRRRALRDRLWTGRNGVQKAAIEAGR